MARIHVVESERDDGTPFLRGMLTRSLQEAGLSFEEAYELASSIRDELSNKAKITRQELRKLVKERLKNRYGEEAAARYDAMLQPPGTITVRSSGDDPQPFSRGQLRRHLESCGLTGEEATLLTADIFNHLVTHSVTEIGSDDLGLITYDRLGRRFGAQAALRYLTWSHFRRGDRPLLLLVGGVPGCGKSTVATEVAHRLEIVRTQSSDMLREVMRMMISEQLLPVLHTSSYAAWETLPSRASVRAKHSDQVEDGYRAQAHLVSGACEAIIQRALTERVSLILEGVHILPSLRDVLPDESDAVVVPIMLAALRKSELRERIVGRGRLASNRRAERYLTHFDDIWHMQSFLLTEADQRDVPIIENVVLERTVQLVITTVVDTLVRERELEPGEVFPTGRPFVERSSNR